ncbi:Leucine-rich repeat flightless-interacting protein 1 [Myotis brandtii]|uniref:Leucine-rich repeat flightless-interacting protein 1 n=1 Tax=Myotis brandtii TaxID=109478 RepID=S7MGB4_MYOBR|nr:Leucine-rich repeat flightless-interacting protein 1 [Myotis brandtii]
MKDSLAEAEEKYKKAMVASAQLDNEKMSYPYKNPDLSEVKEEKQAKSPDEKSKIRCGNPKQSTVAGSSDNLGFPEDPQMELAGKLNHKDGDVNAETGKGRAGGELFEGDTMQASGCRARAEGSEEGSVKAAA